MRTNTRVLDQYMRLLYILEHHFAKLGLSAKGLVRMFRGGFSNRLIIFTGVSLQFNSPKCSSTSRILSHTRIWRAVKSPRLISRILGSLAKELS